MTGPTLAEVLRSQVRGRTGMAYVSVAALIALLDAYEFAAHPTRPEPVAAAPDEEVALVEWFHSMLNRSARGCGHSDRDIPRCAAWANQFRPWLAAHDARVAARAKSEALREAANQLARVAARVLDDAGVNSLSYTSIRIRLRDLEESWLAAASDATEVQ